MALNAHVIDQYRQNHEKCHTRQFPRGKLAFSHKNQHSSNTQSTLNKKQSAKAHQNNNHLTHDPIAAPVRRITLRRQWRIGDYRLLSNYTRPIVRGFLVIFSYVCSF